MDGNALNESTQAFLLRHDLKKAFFEQAQRYFDPLLDVLLWQRSQSGAALIVGVNGAQGSGKSTVCDYWVARCLSVKGVNACCVSIDDFYFDRAKRRRLAEEVHPLLATRGVPGTHDVEAAQAFLDAVRDQRVPLSVPRFDKSTDDPFPASMWPVLTKPVDIVFFEGWCVASEPESVEALSHDVNTLERDQDAQRIWRTYVNDQLDGPYRKLFDRLDSLIFLQAPHFDDVWRWRWQQEKKLHARVLKSGKGAAKGLMTQDEIKKFVAHYQRVTQQNLNCLPRRADVVFRLDSHRRIQAASGRLVQEGVLTFGGANGNFY